MARDTGQINEEMAEAMLIVFTRMHTGLMVRTGIIARIKQKRFNARHKFNWDSDLMFTLAAVTAFGAAMFLAWLFTR
jgi:hypothetical protein